MTWSCRPPLVSCPQQHPRHIHTACPLLCQEAPENSTVTPETGSKGTATKSTTLDYQVLHSLENSAQKLIFFQCCVAVCISRWTLRTPSPSLPGPIRLVCCHARDPSCVSAHTLTHMHAQTQTHSHMHARMHTHTHTRTQMNYLSLIKMFAIFQHSQLYRLMSSSWSLQDPC